MKILVLTERLPSRVGGGAARQFNLIKCLADRHEFTLASYSTRDEARRIEEIRPYANDVHVVWVTEPQVADHSRRYWQYQAWRHALTSPHPRRGRFSEMGDMRCLLQDLFNREKFDIVQVHQAYLAGSLPENTPARTLLDMHDVLSDHERRVMDSKKRPTHRIQGWLEWQKMRRFERKMVRRFDHCLTVSENDRHSISRLTRRDDISIVSNGVDVDYFLPCDGREQPNHLVFTGSMNYPPNAEAIRWFYRDIFPSIRKKVPGVSLTVVGWEPPPDVIALNDDPAVTVTGYVDDVRPYLAQAAVVIVPILSGSGTRLKILDAWAMGKTVVSTSLGAEGLAIEPGSNILLADEPAAFARSVARLLSDSSMCYELGQAGRELVLQQYSWSAIADELNEVYIHLMERPV